MIKSKKDYEFYLEADRISLSNNKKRTIKERIVDIFFGRDKVWQYQKTLRKVEYIKNCQTGLLGKIRYAFAFKKLQDLGGVLGFYIYPNNFGPGLSISHPGTIIVNSNARIGANCRIHPCTVIATQAGPAIKTPKLGDNIYIGPGVKMFGEIEIADNIAIGANSVVNKSFTEPGITIAGVPAKKTSDKGSTDLLIKGSEIAAKETNFMGMTHG
jgi:serine O-acetyltransferase